MNAGDRERLFEELAAYIEGELAPEARARVERAIEESPEMRAQLDWLNAAYADIEAVERGARPAAPEIDIVDSVMQSVRKASAPAEVVSLEAARAGRARWLPALAAAAAVLVIAGYVVLRDSGTVVPVPPTAHAPNKSKPIVAPKTPESPVTLAQSIELLEQKRREFGLTGDGATPSMATTPGPVLQLPGSVAEVVEARAALKSSGGASMQKLLEWAHLNQKAALEVADAPDASPEAMLGAAEGLSGDEQRRVLLTAVGRLEEDPNSRLQLAKNFAETPADDPAVAAEDQAQAQALAQLADVKSLDPENALPYYFEAKVKLEDGDTEGALSSLEAAKQFSEASAYALESALAQAKALEASGMEADAARMVAALTAGVDENNFLCQLAGDLLKYAQDFVSANDMATAQAIYEGVDQLGQQVEAGAELSQEELAGLDIQRLALDGLGQLYATVESAEGVAFVTEATNALTADVIELASFFSALDELFLSPMTEDFWNMVSGLILGSGDLTLFVSAGISPPNPQ